MAEMRYIALLAALALLPAVASAAYERYVVFTVSENVTAGSPVVFSVAKSALGSFRGLFVTNDTTCSRWYDTYYYVGPTMVSIVFRSPVNITAGERVRVILCYGDLDYRPVKFFQNATGGSVSLTVGSPGRESGNAGVYMISGDEYQVDLGGRSHVYNASFTVVCYSRTCSLEIVEAGKTFTLSYYQAADVSASGFDTDRYVTLRDNSGLVYLYRYDVNYSRYTVNSTTVTISDSADYVEGVIDASWFNLSYSGGSIYYRDGYVGGVNIGQPPVNVYVDPEQGLAYSSTYTSAPPSKGRGVNLTFYAYGYEGTVEYSYSLLYGYATPAVNVTLGPETLAQTAGSSSGSGNVSVSVSVSDTGILTAAAGAFLAAAAVAAAYSLRHPELVVAVPVAGAAGAFMLLKADEPIISRIVFVSTLSFTIAIIAYHIARFILRRW